MRSMKTLAIAAMVFSMTTGAHAYSRRVELVNDSRHAIAEFHASNVDRRVWEEDILGRDVVYPGESVTIDINDGTGHCYFDFLTVMSNGDTIMRRNVDVCEISRYRITD